MHVNCAMMDETRDLPACARLEEDGYQNPHSVRTPARTRATRSEDAAKQPYHRPTK